MNFKTYFTYNYSTKKNKITVRKEHFPIANTAVKSHQFQRETVQNKTDRKSARLCFVDN